MNQTTDPTTRRSAQHEPRRVIVGGSYWTLNGVNVFSQNLVRGLRAQGIDAEILLTEEDSHLVTINDAPMPRPQDIPMTALPVPHGASWGRHWGAMIRYLEDHAPCVYIPNSDWRHSSVSPLLSAGVHIVGVVHSDDPLHYDHVHRLGAYWDAIVTTSPFIARKTIAQNPEVAERTQVIPIGVDIPADVPARTRAPGQPVRVIYAGTLKVHQKRILDLPKIVEAAARRRVPMTLTIAGGGPDEAQLRAACAPWVAEGLIHFLGVVEQRAVLDLLAAHDVFIMTSEFEGLPNALLEAMGRGCVPVVTDIDSGIPDVVEDGTSGYLVPVGEIETFVDRLEHLGRHDEQRRHMSAAAHTAVISGRFRVTDMVDSYAALCEQLLREADSAAYRRPLGELNHPPAEIGGVGLFPVALWHEVPGVGAFPNWLPDAREFLSEVRQMRHPERSPLSQIVQLHEVGFDRLHGIEVIVGLSSWNPGGVAQWSARLVRELVAEGVKAHILLTEADTDLVRPPDDSSQPPADLPVEKLPVDRSAGWPAHWTGLIRYLEDHAPCVYIPNDDWRHSCVTPVLSNRVVVVGVLHDDAMHLDHARMLGRSWNVMVTYHDSVMRALSTDPDVARRLYLLPYVTDNAARDYLDVFDRAQADADTGRFTRPDGTLAPPPRSLGGVEIFWAKVKL